MLHIPKRQTDKKKVTRLYKKFRKRGEGKGGLLLLNFAIIPQGMDKREGHERDA